MRQITVTSHDSAGERAYRAASEAEHLASLLIDEIDEHLEENAPWAHRIDDISDVYETIDSRIDRDDESAWLEWSGRVRVRAPRGTWRDGERVRIGAGFLGGFDLYAYEAEDEPDHFLLSVHSR